MTTHDRGLRAVARVREVRERDSRLGLLHALGRVRDQEARVDALALALDQALAPLASPRYVVPRQVTASTPLDLPSAVRVGLGRQHPAAGTVWHPVPDVLGTNAQRAASYARAFDHWVGGGPVLYTGSPEGAGVLAAQVVKPQARVLAESRGIGWVEVDLGVLRGEREPALTLFAA